MENKKEAVITGTALTMTPAALNVISSLVIPAFGFTQGGVGAGSIAAGIQSGIGCVKAGSSFAYLQSVGALGQGILGASVLPVTVAVVVSGGVVYVTYKNRASIMKFMGQSKQVVGEQLGKVA